MRARISTTMQMGENDGSEAWQEMYERQLRSLRLRQELLDRARQGQLPRVAPEHLDGRTQFGRVMQQASRPVVRVDLHKIERALERQRLSPETISEMARWAGILPSTDL